MASQTNFTEQEGFDPFQNRLCRDVRNDLSESLIDSLQAEHIGPSKAVADTYLGIAPPKAVQAYIEDRIKRYSRVLLQIQERGMMVTDTYEIACLLWDQELFFEVHEILEEKWHKSHGIERKVIQAFIRAAGVYVHLEYGRKTGAEKLATKAVSGLTEHKSSVPALFNVDLLIAKLNTLDPIPPKLGVARWTEKIITIIH